MARSRRGALPLHEPVYPLTAGLTNTTLRKAIGEALQRAAVAAGMDRRRLSGEAGLAVFCRSACAPACARGRSRSAAVGAGAGAARL